MCVCVYQCEYVICVWISVWVYVSMRYMYICQCVLGLGVRQWQEGTVLQAIFDKPVILFLEILVICCQGLMNASQRPNVELSTASPKLGSYANSAMRVATPVEVLRRQNSRVCIVSFCPVVSQTNGLKQAFLRGLNSRDSTKLKVFLGLFQLQHDTQVLR